MINIHKTGSREFNELTFLEPIFPQLYFDCQHGKYITPPCTNKTQKQIDWLSIKIRTFFSASLYRLYLTLFRFLNTKFHILEVGSETQKESHFRSCVITFFIRLLLIFKFKFFSKNWSIHCTTAKKRKHIYFLFMINYTKQDS